MYKSNLKKKLFAALAAVCAFVLLLVGIPFAAAPASAAEMPEIQPMTEPCNCGVGVKYERWDAVVVATYTGHTANCTMYEESQYIFLGSNINPNYGSKRVSGNVYTEVRVPPINGQNIYTYPWMRPSVSEYLERYQTHHILGSFTGSSYYAVTDSITTGYITTSARSLSMPDGWTRASCDLVYNTEVTEITIQSGRTTKTFVGDIQLEVTGLSNAVTIKIVVDDDSELTSIPCSSIITEGSGNMLVSVAVR